jgi:hypothetical protein
MVHAVQQRGDDCNRQSSAQAASIFYGIRFHRTEKEDVVFSFTPDSFRLEEDVHYLLFKKDGLMIQRDVQAKGT